MRTSTLNHYAARPRLERARQGERARGRMHRVRSTNVDKPIASAPTGDSGEVRTLDELPRVPGWPGVGMAVELAMSRFTVIPKLLEKLGRAFMIDMGPLGGWTLVVHNTTFAVKAFSELDSKFEANWPVSVMRLLSGTEGSRSNRDARLWRACLARVMTPEIVMELQLPALVESFSRRLQVLLREEGAVDWHKVVRSIAFEVASRAALGDLLSETEIAELGVDYEVVSSGLFQPNFFLRQGLPGTAYNKAVQAKARIAQRITPKIQATVDAYLSGQRQNSVVHKLCAAFEAEGKKLDTAAVAGEMANEVVFLMAAGTDNSATVMRRLIVALQDSPEWLDALMAEQDAIVAEHGESIDRRAVAASPRAHATVNELLRVNAPIKGIFRRAAEDIELGGLSVPKGTSLYIFFADALNMVGPGGDSSFNPARWLEEYSSPDGNKQVRCRSAEQPENLAWGNGARVCIGRNLATVEFIVVISLLMRSVERWRVVEERTDPPLLRVEFTSRQQLDHPLTAAS